MNELDKTYEEFISQFPVYDTYQKAYYAKQKQKGLEAHHITPIGTQEGCNRKNPKDDRCVLLTYSQHIIAHYLYCREHPEDIKEFTALNFLCNFHAKDFLSDGERLLEELPNLEEMKEKGRQETSRCVSKKLKGRVSPNKGVPMTEEQKKKLSLAQKARNFHHSEETKAQWSKIRKGRKCPREVVEKRAKSCCKKVYQYDLEGNLINTFESVKEARTVLNLDSQTVRNYLSGKKPRFRRYLLSYTNSNI